MKPLTSIVLPSASGGSGEVPDRSRRVCRLERELHGASAAARDRDIALDARDQLVDPDRPALIRIER